MHVSFATFEMWKNFFARLDFSIPFRIRHILKSYRFRGILQGSASFQLWIHNLPLDEWIFFFFYFSRKQSTSKPRILLKQKKATLLHCIGKNWEKSKSLSNGIEGRIKPVAAIEFFLSGKWTRIWHFTTDFSVMTYDEQVGRKTSTKWALMPSTNTHIWTWWLEFSTCKETLRCDFSVQLLSITQFFLSLFSSLSASAFDSVAIKAFSSKFLGLVTFLAISSQHSQMATCSMVAARLVEITCTRFNRYAKPILSINFSYFTHFPTEFSYTYRCFCSQNSHPSTSVWELTCTVYPPPSAFYTYDLIRSRSLSCFTFRNILIDEKSNVQYSPFFAILQNHHSS